MNSRSVAYFCVLLLSACSLFSYFSTGPSEDSKHNRGYAWEEYDPSYFTKFQNVQSVIDSTNAHFKKDERNRLAYYNYLAEIIRKRFYHGYSYYNPSDNLFIFLSGKLWQHLSAIVLPEDIMKHPMAACSQQAIVMIEVFKRNGINYRKIAYLHHFAIEAFIDGKWEYFDTNMEPNFGGKRQSLSELMASHRLDEIYQVVYKGNESRIDLSNPKYGEINERIAFNATLFHKFCFLIQSKWLLSFLLLLSLLNLTGLKFFRSLVLGFKREQTEKNLPPA